MKKRNILILTIAAVVIIAAGIVTAVVAQSGHVNIEEQLSLGERYLAEQDYEKAVLAFTKVIEADPMNANAYMGRAKAYAGLGQLENARADFDKCLEIDGDHLADRYLEYGKWLESIGLTEEAQKIFEEGYAQTGDERLLAEIKRLTGEETSGEEESSDSESSGEESSEEVIDDSFTANGYFVPFEEISEAERELILLLVQELTQGKGLGELTESVAYLKAMAPPEGGVNMWTLYEGMKIKYSRGGEAGYPIVHLEAREKNGKAYYYRWLFVEGSEYGNGDSVQEDICWGYTEDWQVTGEVTSQTIHTYGDGSYPIVNPNIIVIETGQAENNYRIGDWTQTSTDYQDSGAVERVYIATYDSTGRKVEMSQEVDIISGWNGEDWPVLRDADEVYSEMRW